MESGILPHLLNFIGDPTGTLKALFRKGLAAVRAFFGKGKGLFRELLKRAVSLWTSRIAPAASAARAKIGDSFASLKRMVASALQNRPSEPIPEVEEPAPASEPAESAQPQQRGTEELETAMPEVSNDALAESTTEPADSAGDPDESGRGAAIAACSRDTARKQLTEITPLLGRALVRALNGKRGSRPVRDARPRAALA